MSHKEKSKLTTPGLAAAERARARAFGPEIARANAVVMAKSPAARTLVGAAAVPPRKEATRVAAPNRKANAETLKGFDRSTASRVDRREAVKRP